MARLQILELPEGGGDDRPPFVLVVDQYVARHYITGLDQPEPVSEFDGITEKVGARAVLVFEETVEIPANDTGDGGSVGPVVQTRNGPRPGKIVGWAADGPRLAQEHTDIARDMDRLAKWKQALADALGTDRSSNWDALITAAADQRQDRDEARSRARHGYEIGQKHCGWSDHGVAPDWLTEGWPPHIDSCEHLKAAAELDEALARVQSLSAEPEVMDAQQEHPGVWRHGYHCGVLAAKSALRPLNEPTIKPPDA